MVYLNRVMATLPTIKKTVTGKYYLVSPQGEVLSEKLNSVFAKGFDKDSNDPPFEKGYIVAENKRGERVLVSIYGNTAKLIAGNSLNDRASNADAVFAVPKHLLRMIEGGFFNERENELEFYFDIIKAKVAYDVKGEFNIEAANEIIEAAKELLIKRYRHKISIDAASIEIDRLIAAAESQAEALKKLNEAKRLVEDAKKILGESEPGDED